MKEPRNEREAANSFALSKRYEHIGKPASNSYYIYWLTLAVFTGLTFWGFYKMVHG